ncbi:hypothetical protein WA158_001954 [Blastocystis sp. Blastoise]
MQFSFLNYKDNRIIAVKVEGGYVDCSRLIPGGANSALAYVADREAAFLGSVQWKLDSEHEVIPENEVEYLSPVSEPKKIICIGINYQEHSDEFATNAPEEPIVFSKFSDTIIPCNDKIICPDCCQELDYECELCLIVKDECYNISVEEAQEHILGYTVANILNIFFLYIFFHYMFPLLCLHDVSSRDWQLKRNNKQWTVGKSFPTFCPIGPHFVLSSEFNPLNKKIYTYVNGELRQNSNTSKMIFNPYELLAWVSNLFHLERGDIILTGTPSGVGAFSNPPKFIHDGDTVICGIEGIGELKNEVIKQADVNTNKTGLLTRL